jgi:hypothetical protein
LTGEAVANFGLNNDISLDRCAVVVISHDCDLAADPDKEPNIEVIVGRFVDKPNGTYDHAKNPRVLHLSFGQGTRWVELHAKNKLAISKAELVTYTPMPDVELDQAGTATLQRWLSSRYQRAAFSNEFEKRLSDNKLDEKIASILKPLNKHVRAIFFDVDDDKEENVNEPYTLTIFILYSTEFDPKEASAAAVKAKEKIEDAFRKKLFEPTQSWKEIELADCITVSDEGLTYAQSRILREWRLEYLSLRDDPPAPMLER